MICFKGSTSQHFTATFIHIHSLSITFDNCFKVFAGPTTYSCSFDSHGCPVVKSSACLQVRHLDETSCRECSEIVSNKKFGEHVEIQVGKLYRVKYLQARMTHDVTEADRVISAMASVARLVPVADVLPRLSPAQLFYDVKKHVESVPVPKRNAALHDLIESRLSWFRLRSK